MTQASEVGHALRGRSDAEILAWVESMGGCATVLEQAFVGMKDAFHADRAAGRSAVIRWDIGTPQGPVSYEVEVADGECTVSRGVHSDARVALGLELPDFMRLVTGCLDGPLAYGEGKLRVVGDLALANELAGWFQETH